MQCLDLYQARSSSIWTILSSLQLFLVYYLRLPREESILLRNAGLTVKLEKCKLLRREIKYLRVKITHVIKTDSEKREVITSMPLPHLKLVNKWERSQAWFSKFIHHFSELCDPLYALKRKRAKFVWSAAVQKSFELLMDALVSPFILVHPNYLVQFELYCDASSVGVITMLTQEGRSIVYASKILYSSEWNYSITKKESLAVI